MDARVWHYDGLSAVRHDATLEAEGESFVLRFGDDLAAAPVPWASLVNRGRRNGSAVYGLADKAGWQIGFDDEPTPRIALRLPGAQKYGRWIDRIGIGPATAAFLATSAIVVFAAIKTPEVVAPLIPVSWERQLGDAMVGDMGGRFCAGPGGQEALDALVTRIDGKQNDIRVRVANISMVNAVALPGGNIVLFRGLLQEAKSADEIAGVVGHEIGHVRNRDVMQALLRQAGLSVIMGGLDGNAGGMLNAMVSATYSREAEARADAWSIKALKTALVSPVDTAGFFNRLAKEEARLGKAKAALGYIASHPLSESREKSFLKSKVAGAGYANALTPGQWQALSNICRNDPKAGKETGLFF